MELVDVENAISARKLKWLAGDTPISATVATPGRFGLRPSNLDAPALQVATMVPEAFRGSRPTKVDWRDASRVTAARYQDICGSCVAFATCAAMESALAILEDEEADLDLAEADLFYCGCGPCCDDGWDFIPALVRASQGVGLEADFPYVVHAKCKRIPPVLRVVSWQTAHSAEDRRWAVVRGPVIAGMRVFDDFRFYKGGVYEHAAGDEVGLHAVCIVGYDDGASCWIVKNSWSRGWGEDGFCRIAYGQCGLDEELPFIGIEVERV
ncbi:C1 family peptidase [Acuticoccus sp. I52.16.1]|uniref:C1 family peptidase n=1 Tax=Acuticoccus sp. I52.16.1 TaxID=2928472 RepID=UPI001FD414A2|nr:C1 family peptidase [Acuticoccus sp. I52.16.1]UOM36702.1 C1 family peptidase [Acuticoccus sp. I52.16.1]